MSQRAFHPDAMAMLSWAADPSGRIEFLSPSFIRMLNGVSSRSGSGRLWSRSGRELHGHDPASGERVADIWEYLIALFTHPDPGGAQDSREERPFAPAPWMAAVRRHLEEPKSTREHELFGLVAVYREPKTSALEKNDGGSDFKDLDFDTISARVMHPRGLRIRGGGLSDIYDLVFVRRIGAGRDGLQGLLQPAWDRVYRVEKANVRTASLRLISRSLSHNIGSHALMYLQKELETGKARKEGDTLEDFDRKLAIMARYLRERFEMMASVSVESPLAWGRDTIRRLVDGFYDNKLLRERICRSEGVDVVNFPPKDDPDPLDVDVGLPGELIARQAFMLMLENVVRDCAKHQRESGGVAPGARTPRVTVHVAVDRLPGRGDGPGLLGVELWASRDPSPATGGEELGRAADRLNKLLREGVICDHEGIPQREWGTLERLMCAAYLRGHRPESLLPAGDGHDRTRDVLGIASPDPDLPLLSARYEPSDRTLRWRFFMPTARAPVAVVPRGYESVAGRAFECIGWDYQTGAESLLHRLPVGCSEILFVALDDDQARHIKGIVSSHRHRMPGFVHVARIGDVPGDRASMLEAWIERRRPNLRVRICDGNGDFLAAADSCKRFVEWAKAEADVDVASLTDGSGSPDLFVLLRHPTTRPRAIRAFLERRAPGPCPCLASDVGFLDVGSWPRLEGHEAADRLRTLVDSGGTRERVLEIARAGAMRVLVADERIGESGGASDQPAFSQPPDLCTVRQRWAMAGVDIMVIGKAADDTDILARLRERIAGVEGGYDYAFIHLGILEKCARTLDRPADPAGRLWSLIRELSASRGSGGEALRLIIHSGRTNPRPPAGTDSVDFRFCPLGNVERVLVGPVNCCKLDVVRMADALWLPSRGAS